MEMNLVPQMAQVFMKEEGGEYYTWPSSEFSVLSEAKLGAGKLVLRPRGFAQPHYADSSKIGYVVQGSCTVGLISGNDSEETVLKINKGDAIAVPLGVISWWFNGGDSDLIIVFLGETSQAYTPGKFSYFFLTGAMGVLTGFSPEFVSKVYGITEKESKTLQISQTSKLIFKLDDGIKLPEPSIRISQTFAFNLNHNDCSSFNFNAAENSPFELSANLVKLDAGSVFGPVFIKDSSFQMIYVIRGSGRIQIVGGNGKLALDSEMEAGQLFVVPKFFVAVQIADAQGMECFSVVTSSKPRFGKLTGNASVWETLPSSVVQASLNVTSQLVKHLKPKN
ncbi:RmlC-like cupins superfamily protein [Forsythia ovata]|uniref:RmlC-like cupins superfamily protein n=1 Tax=Forsythia ovata TaxID=205694 RepID=A0ABD1VI48_9LAMI